MIDLTKLTPAPWEVRTDATGCCVYRKGELFIGDVALAEAEFIILARNAFDVMMRRKWSVNCDDDDGWVVIINDPKNIHLFGWRRTGRDPFTCLVEADQWYAANVENAKKE